ncbi:enoyl-CoA hydratase/isomerase family protein [Phreatobacter stygius]|uniref:Enoyl-CoA hydratase/isomerase family protein n=1 Tax=Phreatobacter stygius TaxID=1940610 RepID=A0A4D7B2N2_9HYPH|nr:enoyl-CoA hydratase/isomerase family protein [Phreatobacter stygius]QCI68019.1 enoyl-CoA hydratase/isomerase family protein [Phreatobacter stygius]
MNTPAPVLHEKRDAAFWITLNRPDKRNAIDRGIIDGVAEGYRLAHADPEVRVIVITGAGDQAFCAGGDLQPGKGFVFDHASPTAPYADLLRLGWNANLPVIARINGACMAGGTGLLGMADMAVSVDTAQFGLPEVKIGVFPMQILSLLQTLVHPRILREWCLTGEPFDANTALAAGLVNYVVPAGELDAKTDWLVRRVAGKSPTAIRRGKYAMRALASMSFEQSIAFTEGQLAILAQTEDAQEGLAAFNEKRKPVWTGR